MDTTLKFKKYLKENNKSLNTIENYASDVGGFFNWFFTSFGKYPEKLFKENVLDYKSYLITSKHLKNKSVNRKLLALKALNQFLVEEGVQDTFVIGKKDFAKYQADFISPTKVNKQEVNQFMQSILETGNKRNFAIVSLLRYTGMRISECLNIKIRDIDLKSGECLIRKGKGSKDRKIFINTKAKNAINIYLEERSKNNQVLIENDLLFKSRLNNRIDRTVISKIFSKFSEKISPHQLRHFFCTELADNGSSIQEIAYLAGHSDTRTTMRYTHPDEIKMKERLENL
ncbi:MAG: tyrosine-type recombinase/integrase [bacterium]